MVSKWLGDWGNPCSLCSSATYLCRRWHPAKKGCPNCIGFCWFITIGGRGVISWTCIMIYISQPRNKKSRKVVPICQFDDIYQLYKVVVGRNVFSQNYFRNLIYIFLTRFFDRIPGTCSNFPLFVINDLGVDIQLGENTHHSAGPATRLKKDVLGTNKICPFQYCKHGTSL